MNPGGTTLIESWGELLLLVTDVFTTSAEVVFQSHVTVGGHTSFEKSHLGDWSPKKDWCL